MTAAQTQRRSENEAFLQNANVRAALEMISKSEGTNGDYSKMVYGTVVSSALFPQLVGKRNVSIPNLNQFPQILVKVNSNLSSSAAGKYQIIRKTYAGAAAAMGLTDFSENTQDLLAIELIRQRGAMNYILAGDIEGALKNSNLKFEWASIPGNSYGQGTHSIAALAGWYRSALSSGAELVKNNPAISTGVLLMGALVFF
jgi:lysozyme